MLLLALVLLPVALAPLVYALEDRSRFAPLAAAAISLAEVALVWRLGVDSSFSLRGRTLAMMPLDRQLFVPLCLLLALAFIYAWKRPQGMLFCPIGLVALGLSAAIIMVDSLAFAVLLLGIVLALCALLIPDAQFSLGTLQAAYRYLTQIVLAVGCLLLLVYLLEQRELHPASASLAQGIRVVLAVGLGMLLAVVPFHSWLSMVAGSAPPLATFILVLLSGTLGGSFIFSLFARFHWLGEEAATLSLFRVAGLGTALFGGAVALGQRKPERLLGYSAIGDMGCILLGFASHSLLGLSGAVLHLMVRGVALLLLGLGLDNLPRDGRSGGTIYRWGVALGGLGLAGFPPLAGFSSRWLIYRATLKGGGGTGLTYLLLIAAGALMVGYLRFLLAPPAPEVAVEAEEGQGLLWVPKVIILVLIAASLILGLYPQAVLGPILEGVEGLLG